MKKLTALLMIIMIVFAAISLTGCFGTTQQATEDPDATEALDASAYKKTFDGFKQYFIDHKIVTSGSDTEVYYDILGADNGIRFILTNSTAFIELYDFTKADNETAKSVLADIKDDGKFNVIEGFDDLTGAISKSGNYVVVYNEKNKFDYKTVTDELENW